VRLSWGRRTTLAIALIATMLLTAVGATAKPKESGSGSQASVLSAQAAGPKADKGPNKQVGARSLDDPLFPQIGNGGYDAQHYTISLDYDPATNTFNEGTSTTITALATKQLKKFSFDFQDLDVSSVTVNGVEADFKQVNASPRLSQDPEVTQPMKLVVVPAPKSRPKKRREFVVEVAYSGAPEQITDPDTSWEGWIRACYPLNPPQTCDGAFVVNEPIGAQSWFPSNNYPTDKATFDTVVTVPASKTALGVGELVSRTEHDDGTATWHWTEDDPTATYLTTATVGDFDFTVGEMVETSTGRSLPIYDSIDSSATQAQKDAINATLARVPEQLNFLSDRLGPYPLDSIGAVADRAAGVGYALEVQSKPHYAGGFSTGTPSVNINTQLHELAHQWLGNSVSPATWHEIWFNEGWATWLTWYWSYEANGGSTSPAEQFTNNYNSGPATKWDMAPAILDNDPANLFTGFPVYTRSAMMLEGYRQILGDDEAFFEFARELLDRFGYGNISLDEFVEVALEMSGRSGDELKLLDDYFDQWLFLEGQPTILPSDF
jgi:aminopeptidase N